MSSKTGLKKHKVTGDIYDPKTTLVYNCPSADRVVTGRIENDTFIQLDEKTLELCDLHKVKYDESLIETEEAENEEEDKEETEEETQEEKKVVAQEEKKVVQDKVSHQDKKVSKDKIVPQDKVISKAEPSKPKISKESASDSEVDLLKNFEKFVSSYKSALSQRLDSYKDRDEKLVTRNTELQNKLSELENKAVETEKQLEITKKELAEVKKKLKGMIALMGDQL